VTQIPVLEIADDIKVEPNHIYVIHSNNGGNRWRFTISPVEKVKLSATYQLTFFLIH
jgi:hypothetical protein